MQRNSKVFQPEAIEQCSTGKRRNPGPGAVYIAGLDLAIAHDYTVLIVAKRGDEGLCEIVYVDRFRRLPWVAQVGRVRAILSRYNDAQVRVDATGLGNPVLSQLREAEVPAEGVVFNQQKKNELIRNLAVLLERGRIVLPMRETCPELHDELSAYEYLDREGGDLRRMGAPAGSHDDIVVAVTLCASYFRGGGFVGRSHIVHDSGYEIGQSPFGGEPEIPRVESLEPDEDGIVWVDDDSPGIHTSGDAVADVNEVRRPTVTIDDIRQGTWRKSGFGGLWIDL